MLDVNLNSLEYYSGSNELIECQSEKNYSVSTQYTGISGSKFCAYFGVILFNEHKKEISRKISWLNDFSNTMQTIKLFFNTSQAKFLQIIYRINNETPIQDNCSFQLLPTESVKITLISHDIIDNTESPERYQLPKLDDLSAGEEDIFEKNLIWIFGSARSGTSWLGTQLLSYKCNSMNEPLIGLHLGRIHNRIKHDVVRIIDLFENEPDYFFSYRYKKTWKPFLRKFILNRFFAQTSSINTPLVIKAPNDSISADILSECFPKSKIIFLIRDGRDIVDSKVDSMKNEDSWASKQYGITPLSDPQMRVESIRVMTMGWVKLMEILSSTYENHDVNLRYKLRYEDIRVNTLPELKKIYDFIGIDAPQDELEKIVQKHSFENIPSNQKGTGKVARSAKFGKWEENFSEEEQKIMTDYMGKTLAKLGYL